MLAKNNKTRTGRRAYFKKRYALLFKKEIEEFLQEVRKLLQRDINV